MAVTTTPRLGVTQWSSSGDPFTRAQMNAAFANVELYASRDEQGLDSAKPAPNLRGRWYFSTDAHKRLYRDDGTTLHELPLISQPNDYTDVQTVALAAESVTQRTSTFAPHGVTRIVGAGAGAPADYALARTGAGANAWALGIAGPSDAAGLPGSFVVGVPDTSKNIPTPLLYVWSTGIYSPGVESGFGAGVNSSGAYTGIGSNGAAAQVAAHGTAADVSLTIRAQGNGGLVVVQAPPGTPVLTVGQSAVTVAQALTVNASAVVTGADSYFGAYAAGAGTNVSRLHVSANSAGATLAAEGDGANRDLNLRVKGTGAISLQDGTFATLAFLTGPQSALTAGQTPLFLSYHNGTSITAPRVTVGAADSGGAGFKLLRVPN